MKLQYLILKLVLILTLKCHAQNFTFSNTGSSNLVAVDFTTINTVQVISYDTLDFYDLTNEVIPDFFNLKKSTDDDTKYLSIEDENFEIEDYGNLSYNDPRIETILYLLNIKKEGDDYLKPKEKIIKSTSSISSLPILRVSAESKNKTIAGSTQTVIQGKSLSQLIGLGASVSGEKDFINIFDDGEISNKGSLNLFYGFGNFGKEKEVVLDSPIKFETNKDFWMAYLSVSPTFSKVSNNIENPDLSLEVLSRTDTYWSNRIGINMFKENFLNISGINLLAGASFEFGRDDNVASLKTGSLVDLTVDTSLVSTVLELPRTVLIGEYINFVYNSISIDGFFTFSKFRGAGIYGNLISTGFNSDIADSKRVLNANIGVMFLQGKKDESNKYNYTPSFGLVFGWRDLLGDSGTEEDKFSFGITTNFSFGSYNNPKIGNRLNVEN